jgi:hypothetical protein
MRKATMNRPICIAVPWTLSLTEPMTVVDSLRAARDRISAPGSWTKWALACDEDGHEVDEDSPAARQWCMLGAYEEARSGSVYAALRAVVCAERGYEGLADFNDAPETTHADVLAVYDRAIALAEKQEQAA